MQGLNRGEIFKMTFKEWKEKDNNGWALVYRYAMSDEIAEEFWNIAQSNCGQIEPLVSEQTVERNCNNCKGFHWLNDREGGWCQRHNFTLNETFDEDLTLDKCGCLQFVPK